MLLIVGGDVIENLIDKLKNIGFESIEHVSGRNNYTTIVHSKVNYIIILTDYVNHNLEEDVKKQAKKRNIPFLCSRHSWSCIYKKMQRRNII